MIGQMVSHYKILEKLGEGGMGVVYRAEDTKLKRMVALKFLPDRVNRSETDKARFLQEAQAAAGLNHPNICTIYGVEEHEGHLFIAMECVDGGTLRERLPMAKTDEAVTMAIQIGEALQEAHAKGIVHRDIKAENIMLTAKNQIKVMDFGLARLKDSVHVTRTGSTLGTLAYMAPEQIQGTEVDPRADIFSFGVVVFEMLTGKLPFKGEHEAAIMYSIVNEEPDSVQHHRQDVPADVDRIIRRALEKDPADRYQHVDDMVSELRKVKKQTARISRPGRGNGEVPAPSTDLNPTTTTRRYQYALLGGTVLLILAVVAYLFIGRSTHRITAIAVLPFVNTVPDSSMEYLSDGFTEGLINTLSKLPGVKMMSRNSVFRYKGKEIDPREVGKKLGVDAIVMGDLGQRGDALEVSVELVSTEDESHLWGEQYKRKASELVSLQGEIARQLSSELHLPLTGLQQANLEKPATANTEAYQLYLKGMYHVNKRRADGFKKALEYLQGAVRADSQFALAYAGLSDCYNLMGTYFLLSPEESHSRSMSAVTRALSLDDQLAESHTALASLREGYEWDWAGAEEHYRKAIAINPSYGRARQWYSELLIALGRHEEAIQQAGLAEEVDPLAPIIFVSSAGVYQSARRFDEARIRYAKAIELDPRFPRAYSGRSVLHYQVGQMQEAISDMKSAVAFSDSSDEYLAGLGFLYGQSGETHLARVILQRFLHPVPERYIPAYLPATLYAGLGDNDNAFVWLDNAFAERSFTLEFLRTDPFFDPLRKDPRFATLMRRVGLPQ